VKQNEFEKESKRLEDFWKKIIEKAGGKVVEKLVAGFSSNIDVSCLILNTRERR
jgi:hypothetical protein